MAKEAQPLPDWITFYPQSPTRIPTQTELASIRRSLAPFRFQNNNSDQLPNGKTALVSWEYKGNKSKGFLASIVRISYDDTYHLIHLYRKDDNGLEIYDGSVSPVDLLRFEVKIMDDNRANRRPSN